MNIKRLILAIFIFSGSFAKAQTALQPGDIAFIAYQNGVTPSAPDRFAFVVMKELEPSTTITFTDKGVIGTTPQTLCTNEDSCKWTAPANNVPVGTVVTLTESGIVGTPAICNIGSAVGSLSNLATAGDQILAYQRVGGVLVFISAISTSGFAANCIAPGGTCTGMTNSTCLPTDLAGSSNFMSFGTLVANGFYSGPTTAATVTDLRTLLTNPANWTRTASTAQSWPSPWTFSVLTSVEKKRTAPAIVLLPNPTNGLAYIKTDLDWATASISNSLGTRVMEISSTSGSTELNLSRLPNGLYFACFQAGDGKPLGVFRIVKK